MKILSETLEKISNIIFTYNNELKEGFITNLQSEINQLFQKNYFELSKIVNLVTIPNYGINIEFIGLTSNYLFPSILYKNNYRIKILKELNLFIKNEFTIDELQIFLSKKIFATFGVKKGGFKKEILEILRFYLNNYDKVRDNSTLLYYQHLDSYSHKYIELSKERLKKHFFMTTKYISTLPIANCQYYYIPSVLFEYKKNLIDISDIRGNLLGLLYDDNKEKEFLLLHVSLNDIKKLKNNMIKKITFFENLDLYYKKRSLNRLRNTVKDIFQLYSDYLEEELTDTAINYSVHYYYQLQNFKRNTLNQIDILTNIFNTRKIPSYFEIHPELRNYYSFRNKVVTFYSSINYLIHVFDPNNKDLDRYSELLEVLFKNSFSNGFIIHYRTGLLISTYAFREDFEKVEKEFKEFILSFKLECQIYENLNYIPFSFYHLPNSHYYSNENNQWEFPVFEDKPVTEYFDHLAINYKLEMKRLEDVSFKSKVNQTLERFNREIAEIKKQ